MALQSEEDVTNEMTTVREYLKRMQFIQNEIEILKEDLKALKEDFKDKLDMKTLNLAIATAKTKAKVAHKFTFENMLDMIEKEGWMEKG